MERYTPRLVPAGSAPAGSLVEPLIEHPPKSPLGEHALIPEVAWMVERDGVFVHVRPSFASVRFAVTPVTVRSPPIVKQR